MMQLDSPYMNSCAIATNGLTRPHLGVVVTRNVSPTLPPSLTIRPKVWTPPPPHTHTQRERDTHTSFPSDDLIFSKTNGFLPGEEVRLSPKMNLIRFFFFFFLKYFEYGGQYKVIKSAQRSWGVV